MKLVLGGGIGGLSAAFYLLQRIPASEIILIEASNRYGGWIKSTTINNQIFELGPRTIRPRGDAGTNTLELIENLKLVDKVQSIKSSHPAAKNRMIYVNGQLHYLPSSLIEIFVTKKPFNRPLAFTLFNELFQPAKKIEEGDESIYNFVERRFGKEIAEYLISPLICGICAGNAQEISVHFLMQSMFELEQKHGSIINGTIKNMFKPGSKIKPEMCNLAKQAKKEKWSVYSLKGGLETLPQTLVNYLQDRTVRLIKNSPCTNLEFYENKVFAKFKEHSVVSDHVICSLSAKQTARLIESQHPQLTNLLMSIPMVTVGVVNLQYKKIDGLNAFGFLVPPSQNIPILGIIFDSCCFATNEHNSTVLTVMMGGHWFEKYFGTDVQEQQLYETAVNYVKDILKVNEKPLVSNVNILKDCIPQYIVGHRDRLKKIECYIAEHKLPLSLCGSSYYGVGINDVILSSKRTVGSIFT